MYKLIIFTTLVILINNAICDDESTLELVHVFFRHGDRTTDTATLYKNDPYINMSYAPYGFGELTKRGKQRAFNVGKLLRKRYNNFLGSRYTPDILKARASPFNRTINTLQLVLAGLFPPLPEDQFEEGLLWQPIPLYHEPKSTDLIFLAIDNCPNFNKFFNQHVQSKQIQKELQLYRKIFNYVSINSGEKMDDYFKILMFYTALKTEEEWGLALPKWTRKLYPNILKSLGSKSFPLLTGTTQLRQLLAGYLLEKIVDDSIAKIEGKLRPKNQKLFLYSGHEFNIGMLLSTLGVFKEHIPPYGAHIMFELHKLYGNYGIKIFYQNYDTVEPVLLKLPACGEFCPFDQFVSLVEEYFPDPETCGLDTNCIV